RAYADPKDLRQVLTPEFPQVVGKVSFNEGSDTAAHGTLIHVDSQGVDWARFLRTVRHNRPDSVVLSAIVDRILLSGALKGLRGTFVQIKGLDDAESTAFEACMPPFTEELAPRTPPEQEGERVAWYADRLVAAGRLARPGAIPVLLYVESIRLAVAPTSAA